MRSLDFRAMLPRDLFADEAGIKLGFDKLKIMVELTRRERKLVDRLERRLAFLTDKIAAYPGRDMSVEVQDRAALLWLLEVAEQASEQNCAEAFTRTSFRNQIVDVALATAEYLRRSSE
jgi:hypothetical protein